jgi:hypothetical protein
LIFCGAGTERVFRLTASGSLRLTSIAFLPSGSNYLPTAMFATAQSATAHYLSSHHHCPSMRLATAAARSAHLLLLSTSLISQRSALAFLTTSSTSPTTSYISSAAADDDARRLFTTSALKMGWSDTWNDILQGGNPRWKVTCDTCHEKSMGQFERFVPPKASVFCPLAGDDPMIHLLWKRGYSVTAIDLVPAAVEAMKNQVTKGDGSSTWTKTEHDDGKTVVWSHVSGRATLYVGDALRSRPELFNKFDAVYDKDSFGALQKEMRTGFCKRIAEYLKKDAIVYTEVKLKSNHDAVKDVGPPFSLRKEDLMEDGSYGSSFDYVEGLGSVYELQSMPMQQTGHILRKM